MTYFVPVKFKIREYTASLKALTPHQHKSYALLNFNLNLNFIFNIKKINYLL